RSDFEGALVLRPSRHIHTLFMRFTIDVAFCDADGVVLRTTCLRPWRLSPLVTNAAFAVEARAGAFEPWGLPLARPVEVNQGLTARPAGALALVGTPIGNLGALSPRAIEVLRSADVIAAEDTRRTRVLLSHAGIPAGRRLRAVHARNEAAQAPRIVDEVRSGARVAVVTDAGMPGISDPGGVLVRDCLDAGLPVEAVPGPSAALTALVLSGLPADRFVFEGFLPRKGRARAERLSAVARESRTTVLFEAPTRVRTTLVDLAGACGGQRPVA